MKSGSPSRTAEYMALFRALESARPPGVRLFDDPDAIRFLNPRLRGVAEAARAQPLHRLITAYIDRRWPGPRLSGVVRTRVIDDFVEQSIAAGCTQMVLLGAGYDTRATRLPALAGVDTFEVDHPTTQAHKRDVMGRPGGRIRYIAVDFEHDSLPSALLAGGFDPGRAACVLWEGVFSYLTLEAIDATLAALVELCSEGSRILITYVDERALDGSTDYPEAWLTAVRDVGEPFRTGIDPAGARAFFAARGLELLADESTAEAAERLAVSGAGNIPGFYRLATLGAAAAARLYSSK